MKVLARAFAQLRLALGSVALILPGVAEAQDEAAIAAARDLGQQWTLDAKAGRCEEAVDKLARAKKLISAPTILVPLGECQITLGKVVVGTENLQIVAREVLPSDAPDAFVKAQKRARQILPDALKKLARLRIDIAVPPGVEVRITDNEEVVDAVLLGVDRPADPSAHRIEVSAPGYLKATAEVTLKSGETQRVELKLEPDPNAAKPAETPIDPVKTDPYDDTKPGPVTPPPAPVEQSSSPLVPVGAAALGVGGAGLILGAVFGGLASSKQSALDEVCIDKLCPNAEQSNIDDMILFGDVSTGALVAGGVLAGLGVTLLAVGASSSTSSSPAIGFLFHRQGVDLVGSF